MISRSSLQQLLAFLQTLPTQAADRMLISEAGYYGGTSHALLDEPVFLETCLVFPAEQWSKYDLNATLSKFRLDDVDITCRSFDREGAIEQICSLDVAHAIDYLKWVIPQVKSRVALFVILGTAGAAAVAGLVWSARAVR